MTSDPGGMRAHDEFERHRHTTSGRALLALWTGVLGAPLVFLAHLQLAYMLVPVDCRLDSRLLAHAASVLGILLAAGGGIVALRIWRRHDEEWPDSSASVSTRDRFLGAMGVVLSALVVLTLIAQWIPIFFIGSCR